ncbi:MAG: Gfo/Idh/MocA family oxidoreductase [Candidatus Hydrogenedentes bacterium]|nr:Gfo/Idh/MocA family oxidoreductase [Candidatus Hydrogenedentota bacterium]
MNKKSVFTRRQFLRSSAALAAAPILIPSSALGLNGAVPPSERIRMGFIGQGGQGSGHLFGGAWTYVPGGYAGRNDVQVMAVCDIRRERREKSCNAVNAAYAERFRQPGYNGCAAYNDFRELLARDDIDAVLMALPLHWHAVMAMYAARAGKDVYCEKPIAVTIQQGRALADTIARTGRVYQAGTQQRSEYTSKFRVAYQLIRAGRIGELKEVYGYRPGGAYAWPGGLGKPQPVPDGLDWDLFLGPAQWLEYDGNPGTFRFSSGDINWTPHHFDFVHWVLDADRTGPARTKSPVTATRATPTISWTASARGNGRSATPKQPTGP